MRCVQLPQPKCDHRHSSTAPPIMGTAVESGCSCRSRAKHPLSCTKLFPGTVSERPKVQLSKSCVGVEPTVGSNPTGSAIDDPLLRPLLRDPGGLVVNDPAGVCGPRGCCGGHDANKRPRGPQTTAR